MLETVERALARQRLAVRPHRRLELARQHRKRRVFAQLVVIVEILVAQHQAENPLPHKRLNLVLDIAGIAPVDEARRKPTHQPEAAIHLSHKQRPGVRCDCAAIEPGNNRAALNRFKRKQPRCTLCLHRGSPESETNCCGTTLFSDSQPRCTPAFEKSRLSPHRTPTAPPSPQGGGMEQAASPRALRWTECAASQRAPPCGEGGRRRIAAAAGWGLTSSRSRRISSGSATGG